MEADPEYPGVGFNMAACFLAIERFNDAMQWLQEYAGKNKEDMDARTLYAKIGGLAAKRKAGMAV
jgi:predicted Zn-dependent protease